MSKTVIRVENVGKLYRLGEVGTGTVSHDLNRWWARMRGKEDPFAKVGQVNDRTKAAGKDEHVWAIKDISFDVQQGEVLGIIGKNGAGKSTLLKILSRITSPTTGSIKIKGRVASLLEVGTGFHPEMTGRENVYLNGTILGMTRREIDRKFEEIMDFAGCLKYADTPVKRYSSGMMVRLGFAVAAFLEPEILIVDEVLAVGDAEFQKKAIGKMQDISKGGGRTVLYVSHNMASVKTVCKKAVLLNNGVISKSGPSDEIVEHYLRVNIPQNAIGVDYSKLENCKTDGIIFTNIGIHGEHGRIFSGGKLEINIDYQANKPIVSPSFVIQIKDENNIEILRLSNFPISGYVIDRLFNEGRISVTIPSLPLVAGVYHIDVGFVRAQIEWYFKAENIITFEVEGNDVYNSGIFLDRRRGLIWSSHNWNHKEITAKSV